MDRAITSKRFITRGEVEEFITTIRNNGWNINSAFIQIVRSSEYYIVFYEKYLKNQRKEE